MTRTSCPTRKPRPRPPGELHTATATTQRLQVTTAVAAKVLAAGSVVGFITGFFGVGGGFVIVPALVLTLGFGMADAVGTSLLVIAINSAVALATRVGTTGVEWDVAIPFTIAGLLGVSVGKALADRLPTVTLVRWFVGLLVVLAGYVVGPGRPLLGLGMTPTDRSLLSRRQILAGLGAGGVLIATGGLAACTRTTAPSGRSAAGSSGSPPEFTQPDELISSNGRLDVTLVAAAATVPYSAAVAGRSPTTARRRARRCGSVPATCSR